MRVTLSAHEQDADDVSDVDDDEELDAGLLDDPDALAESLGVDRLTAMRIEQLISQGRQNAKAEKQRRRGAGHGGSKDGITDTYFHLIHMFILSSIMVIWSQDGTLLLLRSDH